MKTGWVWPALKKDVFGISVVFGKTGMKEISAYWAKYVIAPASVWKGDQKNDHAEGAAIGWLCEREGVHDQRATMVFGEGPWSKGYYGFWREIA